MFLKANPDIAAKIETAIRQNAGLIADRLEGDVGSTPEAPEP
jgi:recombination protein RecA